MRTHVILPEDLVKEVDNLVGKRKRSKFLAEALAEKIRRLRLEKAAEESAGALKDVETAWRKEESSAEWVRKLRREDDKRLVRVWKDRGKVSY